MEQTFFQSILKYPDFVMLETEDRTETLSCCQSEVSCDDIHVSFDLLASEMNVAITASSSRLRVVKLRWNMTMPDKIQVLSDAWERGYGDMEWKGLVANRFMPWYFLINRYEHTAGYGVKVRPSAMCFWQLDSAGMTLWMDVRCGGLGVNLNGRTLNAASIVCQNYSSISAFLAAKEFCKVMCTDPIFPEKPVYGSNNWYYAYGISSEDEILSDGSYLAELVGDVENRPYMVIDDCWQEHHRACDYNGGPWRKGNEKFPDLKRLAQKLDEKKLIPGIWVRFLLNEDAAIPDEWRLSHNGCLDPSHPDALKYIQDDTACICNWGYKLIKHDFSTFDIFGKWGFQMQPFPTMDGWSFYDKTKTTAEIVINFYKKILESTTKGTLILGCNTIGHLGAGLMHMNRTSDDTSGIRWERTRKLGVNTLAFRMPHHRTFYDVDADCIGITGDIPWELNREWTKLLGLSSTSLFVSAKPGVLNEEETNELREALLLSSKQENQVEPLDWQYNNCPENWNIDGKIHHFQWYEKTGLPAFGLDV